MIFNKTGLCLYHHDLSKSKREGDLKGLVNIENTEKIKDTSIQRQILECNNMFNFFVRNFEYDDDDILENDWAASYT